MTEKACFTAGGKLTVSRTELDGTNRRSRGLADRLFCFVTYMRTCIYLSLPGGNLHTKGKTCWYPTVSTICFGKHLEDLYTC